MFNPQAQHLEEPPATRLDALNISAARGDETEAFQYGDDFVLVVSRNTRFEYFGAELFHIDDTESCEQVFFQNPDFEACHSGWNDITLMELAHHCAQWLF